MLFVPGNSHMEQPTKFAYKLHIQVGIQTTDLKLPLSFLILEIIDVISSKLII